MKSDGPDSVPNSLRIPKHVAIIMDGNGRWANARGLPRVEGHEVGAESVRQIVRACREMGVKAVTLYSFSTENWHRPTDEVEALMALLARYLVDERQEIMENQIGFRAIGQLDRLPGTVRDLLSELTEISGVSEPQMTLCLALSYGSRAELVEATRAVARQVASGALAAEEIDESVLAGHLQTVGLPEPDLLIRTSGELRLSNFLLWQLAYAEIYVTDVLWPDFRKPQLMEAFEAYSQRQRRFGRTQKQVEQESL